MAGDLARLLAMLSGDTSGTAAYREPPAPTFGNPAEPPLDPRVAAMVASQPALAPSGYAKEPPLHMEGPSRLRSVLDAVALAAAQNPPQLGRHASGGERFLGSLLSGAGTAYSRGRLTDEAERQLFNRAQEDETAARVKERDASFKDARTKAAAVKTSRISQMRRAIERWQTEANAADDHARNAIPGDVGQQTSFVAKRDRALGEIARIEKDLARLEGREPVTALAPAPITARTPKATKPKPAPKPKTEAAGETRRKVIAAITVENGNDPVRIRAYLNRPGVLDTLANRYGITQAEVLRAVPE